jgi:quinol monooxygenase YgiN
MRMGFFSVKPDQVTNLKDVYNGVAVPKVRAFPGNLGCLLLEPQTAGERFIALTIWEDRGAAEKYEASGAAGEVVALVRDFFAGPPTLHSYQSASVAGLPTAAGR